MQGRAGDGFYDPSSYATGQPQVRVQVEFPFLPMNWLYDVVSKL